MSKSKKVLGLFVAFVILFAAVFYGISSIQTLVKAESVASMEEVDEYLRNNGYSEDFINEMGEQTKLHLYNQGAVFVSNSSTLTSRAVVGSWSGFSHQITVSDITEDSNQPKFILTYNFGWHTGIESYNDCFIVNWNNNFTALSSTAVYEIYGNGILVDKDNSASPSIPIPSVCESRTFLHKTGDGAVSTHYMDVGVGKKLYLDQCNLIRKYYVSGAWGDYGVNPESFNGAFSITISKINPVPAIGMAVASFYHWTESIDYQFQLILGNTNSIGFTASDSSHYEKSEDTSQNFYF